MSRVERVVSAAAYDTLELSAFVFAGIGRGAWFDNDDDWETGNPVCWSGHVQFGCNANVTSYTEMGQEYLAVGISVVANDGAVAGINQRLGRPIDSRVSFSDWCAALGVVRGK